VVELSEDEPHDEVVLRGVGSAADAGREGGGGGADLAVRLLLVPEREAEREGEGGEGVREAKTGSRLAEIIQAGLRAADGPASAITATWGANTLTLTDVGLTRDWSAGNLYDAVGLAPKMGYVIGLNSCWMRGVVVGGNTNGTTKVSLDIMP
jgi:hypothetical protein